MASSAYRANHYGDSEGNGVGPDETDRHSAKSASSSKSRSSSVPAHARKGNGAFTMPRPPTSSSTASSEGHSVASSRGSTAVRRNHSMRVGASAMASGQAGAMDEEQFMAAFEEVKRVSIFNGRAITDEVGKIKDILSKSSNDWKMRVDALQNLRALFVAGAANYEEMTNALRTLHVPFQVSIKDLRSQVVREACITVAYMSQQLGQRADRFLETLLQPIINLIPNSARVMATSGIVCMRFLIQNTNSGRFLPILCENVSSKSREIRRHTMEFLDQLLHTWPTHCMRKHVAILQDAIKKGIADADPDARQYARKAYWGFADHFKDAADVLLNSLDGTYKRMLQANGMGAHPGAGGEVSNSSSSNSLHNAGRAAAPAPRQSRLPSSWTGTGSQENLQHQQQERRGGSSTLTRKNSGIPTFASPMKGTSNVQSSMNRSLSGPFAFGVANPKVKAKRSRSGLDLKLNIRHTRNVNGGGGGVSPSPMMSGRVTPSSGGSFGYGSPSASANPAAPMSARSNSAIDPSAVRRATIRAQYAARNRIAAGGTLSRSRKSSLTGASPDAYSTPPTGMAFGRSGSSVAATAGSSGAGHRSRPRVGVTHSQPGSRSTSPSSLRSYQTYHQQYADAMGARRSRIPRSTASSREQSPARHRRPSGGALFNAGGGRFADRPPKRPMMTEDILRQSREAENALADALPYEDYVDATDDVLDLVTGEGYYDADDVRHNKTRGRGGQQHHAGQHLTFDDTVSDDGSEASSISSAGGGHRHHPPHSGPMKPRYLQSPNPGATPPRPPSNKTPGSTGSSSRLGGSTGGPAQRHYRRTSSGMAPADDSENLNPEDVHKSLRSTANAIQNYSFESPGILNESKMKFDILDGGGRSVGGGSTKGTPTLEEKMSLLDISSSSPGERAAERSTTPSRNGNDGTPMSVNRQNAENSMRVYRSLPRNMKPSMAIWQERKQMKDEMHLHHLRSQYSGGGCDDSSSRSRRSCSRNREVDVEMDIDVPFDVQEDESSALAIQEIMDTLQTVKTQSQTAERRSCMTQIIRMTREGRSAVIQENFRAILRLLLENLSDETGATRALVFGVLTEMLKQDSLVASFQAFTELIILKVLEAHRDDEKDVERAAEGCASAMAGVLPPDVVIRVLNPIIKTGDFPVNQAAIKMLTRATEHPGNETTVRQYLPDIMPGLLKAYDNVESSVRKAAVFCMVSLHQLVGDELQPHLECLNGSKLKLLNLYIKRAQAQKEQSAPVSPRLATPL